MSYFHKHALPYNEKLLHGLTKGQARDAAKWTVCEAIDCHSGLCLRVRRVHLGRPMMLMSKSPAQKLSCRSLIGKVSRKR